MVEKRKLKPLKDHADDSDTIKKLTEEAVDDWDDIEIIRKLFPAPKPNPFPYPFKPVRPAKWKHYG